MLWHCGTRRLHDIHQTGTIWNQPKTNANTTYIVQLTVHPQILRHVPFAIVLCTEDMYSILIRENSCPKRMFNGTLSPPLGNKINDSFCQPKTTDN